jgi:hypothetical protein
MNKHHVSDLPPVEKYFGIVGNTVNIEQQQPPRTHLNDCNVLILILVSHVLRIVHYSSVNPNINRYNVVIFRTEDSIHDFYKQILNFLLIYITTVYLSNTCSA